MRVAALILILSLALTAQGWAAPRAAVFDPAGIAASGACDGKLRTSWKADSAASFLSITGGEPFSGLYIQWETLPLNPRVEYASGEDWRAFPLAAGVLNQYVALPEPAHAVRIYDDLGRMSICEIRPLYDEAEASQFQRWAPPAKKADILILAAHPDDDLLYFGGTLPVYGRERGLAVQIVFLSAPGRARQEEALAGQWLAGGRHHPVFGSFADRRTYTAEECARLWDRDRALAFIVEQIRRFKPDVVLTHDLDGEYGHGAHMLTAQLALEAIALADKPEQLRGSAEMYGAHAVQKAYLHLYPQHKIEMDWSVALDSFEGRTAIEIAREAFRCHVSQQGYGLDVRDRGIYSSTKFGLAYTRVGYDEAGGDFMENVWE